MEGRNKIIKEAHSDHLGEQNTLDKARKLGIWQNMEQYNIKYVKTCPICQLNKTTRIKYQMESVIPDILIRPEIKS